MTYFVAEDHGSQQSPDSAELQQTSCQNSKSADNVSVQQKSQKV